jgi:hypothetical protein
MSLENNKNSGERLLTIREIHQKTVTHPAYVKAVIKQQLGLKTDTSYYDRVLGRKKLNEGEKLIIANAYGVNVNEVNWQ